MSVERSRTTFLIREPRQIEALGSPARQEVLDGLQAMGPCSVAALAELLGRAPDSLYYHVRKLQRVGLVVPCGTRDTGTRAEALFDVPGLMVIDYEPETARERARLARLVASALRIAERDFRAALESGHAIYRRNSRRNAWGARVKGWLTRSELAEVRRHLDAVSQLFADGKKRRGTLLQTATFVLAPLTPSPRVRRDTKSPEEDR
jgi:hypothetical protein